MKVPVHTLNGVTMPGFPADRSVRELYHELLNRHPLLKDLATHQQIELPFASADTHQSTWMRD